MKSWWHHYWEMLMIYNETVNVIGEEAVVVKEDFITVTSGRWAKDHIANLSVTFTNNNGLLRFIEWPYDNLGKTIENKMINRRRRRVIIQVTLGPMTRQRIRYLADNPSWTTLCSFSLRVPNISKGGQTILPSTRQNDTDVVRHWNPNDAPSAWPRNKAK